MKLLMITGLGSARDLASGKKGAFYNTLEEFHKYWERIDIICPKLTSLQAYKLSSLFGNVYVHISPWPLVFHPIWFLKKGLEIYKEQKFDLITVQDFPPFYNGIGARLLWNKIRVPYVLEFHHISGYPKASNLKEKIYANQLVWKFYWKVFGSKAKAVRVVNRRQAPEFLVRAGVPEEKIVYISSIYLDLNIFKPMNLQKEYDIIFIGRLEKNKGLDLLLEAIKKLTSLQAYKLTSLVVGDGPLKNNLKFKIENLKLQNNILLYGWAKDSREVAELINKSKILVMPSYNEGGPRVVVEAMACGVPILATPVGIVPDIIKNGENGEIIRWDAQNIAQKAQDILNNQDKQEKYKKAGINLAAQFEKGSAIKNYAEKLKGISGDLNP